MNTFEISCIEINRYDRDGNLIEEPAGYLFLGSTHNGEEGMLHLYLLIRTEATLMYPLHLIKIKF